MNSSPISTQGDYNVSDKKALDKIFEEQKTIKEDFIEVSIIDKEGLAAKMSYSRIERIGL